MRWRQGRRSENVDDLRGSRVQGGGLRLGVEIATPRCAASSRAAFASAGS